ncbi:MAG: sugar ABC transporter permease [Candidatus Limiplasma sp.]|nr:sugar ABC transporter permease [Candidatus Limiplasma sp.]
MKNNKLTGYLFIAPSFIGMTVFMLVPFVLAVTLSFAEWNHLSGLNTMQFMALENYTRAFTDKWFLSSLQNNLLYSFIGVPVSVALALAAAVFLNDRVYMKKLLRALYFFPYITNGLAVYYVWMLLFQPKNGLINMALKSIGMLNVPNWLMSTDWALPALIIINIWATIGYNVVIYIANIQNISSDVYEAGEIDGATGWQRFRYITFPLLTPSTFFLLTTGIITSFKVFGIVAALTQGGPVRSTTVIAYYAYVTAFRYYDMGYASAMSVMLFLMILIVTLVQWKLQKKWVHY